MSRDLRFEAYYPHSPAKVWRALTEPQLIERWLMPNDFRPEIGHRFQFTAPPQPGWDGKVYCEVLECEPPHRLVYSWKNNLIDTIVRFTLREENVGTRLVLEHQGFKGFKGWMVRFILGSGWKGMVAKHILNVVELLDDEEQVA